METKMPEMSLDVVERLPDAVALLDREARFRYVNPAAERLLGKARHELVGQVAWQVAAEPLGPELRASFPRVLAGEEVVLVHNCLVRGTWLELRAVLVRGVVMLFARDITEHLRAAALHRETEERFQILVDGLSDYALMLLDLDGRIVSWNLGGERVFGHRADDVLGKEHAILYPPGDLERARRALEGAVAQGRFDEESASLVRKDGSRFVADCTFYPLYGASGQARGFAVITRDVTERRQMEERIRNSEERLRLAAEAAEVGTYEYVIETGATRPDARLLTLFGLPPELASRLTRQDMVDRMHPADRARVNRAVEEALAGGDYHVEYRVIRASDGVERWLESRGKALRDPTGKPVRMLGLLRDVTERHRYDEFRALLPGILAHDLRTPLSTIKMASQMILKTAALPSNATRYADATLRSTAQMMRMAEQLLAFTQARFGGGLPLERAATDLAEVCREVVLSAQVTSPERQVHFAAEGDAHGQWDRTRLTEVASNLLGNALKHGAPEHAIDVAVRDDGDHVVLTVRNGGPPIPPELLPVLFDPFRRGERSQSGGQRGYGLGLYISREIVVAHGGTLDVRSSSEAGTTFTVRLPRGAAPALATATAVSAGPAWD